MNQDASLLECANNKKARSKDRPVRTKCGYVNLVIWKWVDRP